MYITVTIRIMPFKKMPQWHGPKCLWIVSGVIPSVATLSLDYAACCIWYCYPECCSVKSVFCLSVFCPTICIPFIRPVRQSPWSPSICLSLSLSVYLSVCLSVFLLAVCLSVWQSVCLPAGFQPVLLLNSTNRQPPFFQLIILKTGKNCIFASWAIFV